MADNWDRDENTEIILILKLLFFIRFFTVYTMFIRNWDFFLVKRILVTRVHWSDWTFKASNHLKNDFMALEIKFKLVSTAARTCHLLSISFKLIQVNFNFEPSKAKKRRSSKQHSWKLAIDFLWFNYSTFVICSTKKEATVKTLQRWWMRREEWCQLGCNYKVNM